MNGRKNMASSAPAALIEKIVMWLAGATCVDTAVFLRSPMAGRTIVHSDAELRLKRSKQSERDLGHWLLDHDGPDLRFKGIASSTGRVGHITNLQFDVISKTYAAENKQVRVPALLWRWWKKITDVAIDQGKEPLLRIDPTNQDLSVPARLRKRIPSLHILTEGRHAELLDAEQERNILQVRLIELEEELENLKETN